MVTPYKMTRKGEYFPQHIREIKAITGYYKMQPMSMIGKMREREYVVCFR